MAALAAPFRLVARASARSRARRGRLGRRTVLRLGVVAAVLAGLGAGYLWLRDSSLVSVREVFVTGVSSSQEARVRQALRRSARGMTTLAVREDELRAAVAPYASVADLEVDRSPPHRLTIAVVERRAAALAVTGSSRVPVDRDGRLLRGVRPEAGLPVLRLDSMPTGDRVAEPSARAAVAVLAGVPGPLRGRVERIGAGPRGLRLELRDGPVLIFGSAERVRAKWLAAGRVLAASSARGATYVDVRVPEWAAAGGVQPLEPDPTPTPGAADGTAPAAPAAPAPEAPAEAPIAAPTVAPTAPIPNPQP